MWVCYIYKYIYIYVYVNVDYITYVNMSSCGSKTMRSLDPNMLMQKGRQILEFQFSPSWLRKSSWTGQYHFGGMRKMRVFHKEIEAQLSKLRSWTKLNPRNNIPKYVYNHRILK